MVRIVRLPSPALCLAWNPDGARVLAGAKDGRLLVIDGDSDAIRGEARVATGPITSLAATRRAGKVLVGTSTGFATMQAR